VIDKIVSHDSIPGDPLRLSHKLKLQLGISSSST
jgi:hypothetical protein